MRNWIFCLAILLSLAEIPVFADVYCGVYSVYGAACALGKPSDFSELVNARYISSRKGSSIGDLVSAGEAIGVRVTPYWHLSEASLRKSRDPMVLHFSSFGQLNEYDHWVLFLGMEGERAVVVDSASGRELLKMSDVLVRWDGIALVVNIEDRPMSSCSGIETLGWIGWGAMFAGVCFIVNLGKSRWPATRLRTVFIFFALLVMTQLLSAETYLNSQLTLMYAAACYSSEQYECVSLLELEEIVHRNRTNQSQTLLVDARFSDNFTRGTLPGALNIPVDSGLGEIRQKTASYSKATPIVVFCLTDKCDFDRKVAVKLSGQGFVNIRIFEDG